MAGGGLGSFLAPWSQFWSMSSVQMAIGESDLGIRGTGCLIHTSLNFPSTVELLVLAIGECATALGVLPDCALHMCVALLACVLNTASTLDLPTDANRSAKAAW